MNQTISSVTDARPAIKTTSRLKADTAATGEEAFGDMISSMLTDTATALNRAETTSVQALEGKASIQQVVDTVMAAERQLHTVLALRDKIVSAYLEISRMAI